MLPNTLSLQGITSCTRYTNGNLMEATVDQPNLVRTGCGDLVPHYSRPDQRSKDLKSISFHPDGAIRSVCLDKQVPVQTPIGPCPAELVTFHPDGALDAVFPLNGQIGFGWSEEDEKELADTFGFEFGFGSVTAKIIAIRFYPTGELQSLLLWPGEVTQLATPAGVFPARGGIRLYRSGALESFELAVPIALRTPVGPAQAYDVNALTMDADSNSVRFSEGGNLISFLTSGDVIVLEPGTGRHRISSQTRLALARDVTAKLPMQISFEADMVVIDNGAEVHRFSLTQCRFLVLTDIDTNAFCATSCDSCALGCA